MTTRNYTPLRDELQSTPPDAPLPGEYRDLSYATPGTKPTVVMQHVKGEINGLVFTPINGDLWEACCVDCWRLILGAGEHYIEPYRCPPCQEQAS